MSKILVTLNQDVRTCDCCHKTSLKRTLELALSKKSKLNLGVICAGQWFEINLTGNPWYAAERLENKINDMSKEDFDNTLMEIQSAT